MHDSVLCDQISGKVKWILHQVGRTRKKTHKIIFEFTLMRGRACSLQDLKKKVVKDLFQTEKLKITDRRLRLLYRPKSTSDCYGNIYSSQESRKERKGISFALVFWVTLMVSQVD